RFRSTAIASRRRISLMTPPTSLTSHRRSQFARASRHALVVTAVFTLMLVPGSLRADDVLPGSDLFQTLGCGSHVDFGTTFPIPAGFFDPGSDPFTSD